MFDKDTLRRQKDLLMSELRACGVQKFIGNKCACPFHGDEHASAGVFRNNDGFWYFHCHTNGCGVKGDVFDMIARREGKPVEEILKRYASAEHEPPKTEKKVYASEDELAQGAMFAAQGKKVEAVYRYTHPESRMVEMLVIRIQTDGGKTFMQGRPHGKGFVLEAPPKPWPLYNRTRLKDAKRVVYCEGEKVVHALVEALDGSDATPTTGPGGAGEGKAALIDYSPLAGKDVYLWPDNDPPDPKKNNRRTGIEFMRDVSRRLETLDPPPRLFWIDPDELGLPPKGDAVEYLQPYVSKDEKRLAIESVLDAATPMGASREIRELFKAIHDGAYANIEWPYEVLSKGAQALLPGSVICVCGDPGSTKSLLMIAAHIHWWANGIKTAIFELEEDRPFHLRRAMAQFDQNANLNDTEWVASHKTESELAVLRNQEFLDGFGRVIHTAPDNQVTLEELAKWVRQRSEDGCRIITIDPITMAATSQRPWIDDLKFLVDVKTIARQYGNSIILVTHPRKGAGRQKSSEMDDLAGGAAYQRFTQCVLWVQRMMEPEQATIKSIRPPFDVFIADIDRKVQIRKARNGKLAGATIGMRFLKESLAFEEIGLVVKDGTAPGQSKQNSIVQIKSEPAPPAQTQLSFDEEGAPV